MMKSLPLLSAILLTSSALVAITAACSSSSSVVTDNGDGGGDASKPRTDSGPIGDDDDDDGGNAACPTTQVITQADIDGTDPSWKPPVNPPQSVCTQADLDEIKKQIKAGTATTATLKAALGANCSPCVFTALSAANWGVYLEVNADGGIFNNGAYACHAEVEGNDCGKSLFYASLCLDGVCNLQTCGKDDDTTIQNCSKTAVKGACKDLFTAFQTNCPNYTAANASCGNVYQAVAAVCGGGADAGLDAAAP